MSATHSGRTDTPAHLAQVDSTGMRESALEARFRQGVKALGGKSIKLAPTEKGVPDRLALLPGGRMFLVELKTETGRISPRQRWWHLEAQKRGTAVIVLAGVAQVDQWLIDQKDEEPT